MNKKGRFLLTLGALLPLATLASGGDVLEWIWIEFFVLVAFVSTLVFAKINYAGKGVMIVIFLVTECLTMKFTGNLSYSKNKLLINVISIAAPTVTTILSYWIMKSRFKKEQINETRTLKTK